MTASLATVSYIGATILFILSLGGLANPETAPAWQPLRHDRHGHRGAGHGASGPRVTPAGIGWIVGALAVGGGIGLFAAKKVQMTQMPSWWR